MGIAFCVIVTARIAHVVVAFKNELIGLASKPVQLQLAVGVILLLVTLVATIMAARDDEYLEETAAMEEIALDKMEDGAPLVYFLIGLFLFFALMSAPGMCMPDKMIEGYMPHKLPKDRYGKAQMSFYMIFQSREQFFTWFLFAALLYMSPNIVPMCILIICMALFFLVFCIHSIVNADFYGFALPGMLFWLICMSAIIGATGLGLFLI